MKLNYFTFSFSFRERNKKKSQTITPSPPLSSSSSTVIVEDNIKTSKITTKHEVESIKKETKIQLNKQTLPTPVLTAKKQTQSLVVVVVGSNRQKTGTPSLQQQNKSVPPQVSQKETPKIADINSIRFIFYLL